MVDPKALTDKAQAIAEIANRVLGLQTLDTQNSDSLDFHDLSVASIRAALDAAYESGFRNASRTNR